MSRREASPLWGEKAGVVTNVGDLLREYRSARGLTQRQLGEELGVDQSYVSKIEGGKRPARDIGFLLSVAQLLDIPPSRLGLSDALLRASSDRALRLQSQPEEVHGTPSGDPLSYDQDQWRQVRSYLNRNRGRLARDATRLYPSEFRVGRTTLLAPPEWIPPAPVELDEIELELREHRSPAPLISGTEPETNRVRPLRGPGQQYASYTSAVRYLDPPSLFENRPSYRLHSLTWDKGGRMEFGLATYFDKLDVAEALGHELAAVSREHEGAAPPVLRELPFRTLVGDPFDSERRCLLPAVTTLMLRRKRRTGRASFLLHWRDPSRVATAAGIYDVIPAGEFQPSSIAAWDQYNDFALWKNIARELSEELLGEPEHDGSRSTPIDYEAWPLYRQLQEAKSEGKLRAYALGAAVDALTLAPTILTAIVIDDDIFDSVFRDAVNSNSEGLVVSGDPDSAEVGFEFDHMNVARFVEREPMASPGAGCLELAWRHRIALMAA